MDLSSYDIGYDIPAKPGMSATDIQTPALVIDLDALDANLRKMARYVQQHDIHLRPHGKMHKSADIARRQHDIGGANGICCQKASEAEAFIRAGIKDVLITNQIRDAVKLNRLAQLSATGARITLCVDDPDNVAEISAAATQHQTTLSCLVELECGARRCGVATPETAAQIAQAIAQADGLIFDGVQAYHGTAQHLKTHAARESEIGIVLHKVRATLAELQAAGLKARVVSGAGTGSHVIEATSGLYTELQCGSYAFMDADYGRLHNAKGQRLDHGEWTNALFVLTSVISKTETGRAICDAGLKAIAMDSGPPVAVDAPGVEYTGPSDEHGILLDPKDKLRTGDKLRLIPGHCDPTCNLHEWYVGVRARKVETLWPITARGKLL